MALDARLLDRAGDLLEDGVDLDTSGRDGAHRDERDQSHEQCILEQVLGLILPHEPVDEILGCESSVFFLSVLRHEPLCCRGGCEHRSLRQLACQSSYRDHLGKRRPLKDAEGAWVGSRVTSTTSLIRAAHSASEVLVFLSDLDKPRGN